MVVSFFFLCSSLFGEDEPILTSIFFQMCWFNHQPDLLCETMIAHDEFGSRCLEWLRWCSSKMDRNMYAYSVYINIYMYICMYISIICIYILYTVHWYVWFRNSRLISKSPT